MLNRSWLAMVAAFALVATGCGGADDPEPGSGGSGGDTGSGGTGGSGGAGGSGGDEGPVCGNGVIEGDEECEGDDFGGKTCADFGHNAGSLSCDGCRIDASACQTVEICDNDVDDDGDGSTDCDDDDCAEHPACQPGGPVCGNGVLEQGEQCDGGVPDGMTCADVGNFNSGTLACNLDTCQLVIDGCALVELCDVPGDEDGNGVADCDDEACEDHEACQPVCGDGIIEGDEECEGDNFGGRTCADFGHNAGSLSCDGCRIDASACHTVEICDNQVDDDGDGSTDCDDDACAEHPACQPVCGNGILEAGEQCDGGVPPGVTCADLGNFNSGTPACDGLCNLDVSGCALVELCDVPGDEDGNGAADCEDPACAALPACADPTCGDGIRNQEGEECDGSVPPGLTCANFGNFNSGSLACTDQCTIDTSGCALVELCTFPGDDDGNGLADCEDPACAQQPPCPVCGNGIVEAGEECDNTGPNCDDQCQFISADLPGPNGSLVLTGSLAADDPLYHRPNETCSALHSSSPHYYDAWYVTNRQSEARTVLVRGDWTGADGFLLVYGAGFDPTSGLTSCLAGDDDLDGDRNASQVDAIEVGPGETIVIVATTWSATTTMESYTLTIRTWGTCGDGTVGPGEICDPGAGEGCSETCEPLDGWVCDETGCRQTVCGDGVVEGDEECDGEADCAPDCTWIPSDCSNPIDISAFWNDAEGLWRVEGDTSRSANNFTSTCGGNGPDVVLTFTAPTAGNYFFNYFGAGYDALLHVWAGACGDAAQQLACADDPEEISLELQQGELVYVIADGWSATLGGTFVLEVSRTECGNSVVEAGEDCDDGNDVDDDGCTNTCRAGFPEREPNDSMAQATPLPYGAVGVGIVSTPGESDFWAVELEGDSSYLILTGTHADSDCIDDGSMDHYLFVYDRDGNMLLYADDDYYFGTLCPLDFFETSYTGTYYIEVSAYGAPAPYYLFLVR